MFGKYEDLEKPIEKMTNFYDEIDKASFLEEIKRFRRHIAAAGKDETEINSWNALQILQLIVKLGFIEVVPNLSLCLRLFLTVCVSVSSCERSFSKLKLIKNYLRSTIGQSRLTNLAILSIENELSSKIDFDEVITKFASMKARRKNF